ncbi:MULTISPECIES: hypothetical protein [Rhodopirellula]|uniref:hypothetical protein n=1 Tax=Rhodopirellula TaxID=265488 RepID=UPI00257B71F1|nr:hypothetical protein [Rhodopirellula sp. UBA1907]|tara:strand:+ start:766 stop:1326 length:561 start_codon:yes stop_codon:yes gene_type:complete
MNSQRNRLVHVAIAVLISLPLTSMAMAQEPNAATDDVDVRYFQKKLELAKHDRDTALKANRRIPGMNSKLSLLRLQNQVAYATKLVEHAGKHADHDLHKSHLQSLKNDVILAEEQLAWARKASGYVREDQLKRLELNAQLARLALERAEQPEITADPMQHLQWQIDRLRSELLSLQIEFERTRSGH